MGEDPPDTTAGRQVTGLHRHTGVLCLAQRPEGTQELVTKKLQRWPSLGGQFSHQLMVGPPVG